MSQPHNNLKHAVRAAAKMLQYLSSGQLAELRRMDRNSAAPAFWRLVARHPDTIGDCNRREQWIAIVRILAILTPKGSQDEKPPLHDKTKHLGMVLCDGGNPDWHRDAGENKKPVFSEQRLAQLIAARGRQRIVLLERAARMLTRSRTVIGINVVDILYAVVSHDAGQFLAESFYRRLDQATYTTEFSKEGTS